MFLGYSLQLWSQSSESIANPHKGEWISKVIPMTSDWLCVSMNLSVPATFQVSVDLLRYYEENDYRQIIYTVENAVGETLPTDIVTVFQVKAEPIESRQLVVNVSEGTVIRNINIQNKQCNITSKFIT